MSYPHVYLIKIPNGAYGFRVVAVIAEEEEEALQVCREEYGAQTDNRTRPYFAQVMDHCSVGECRNVATFEFQE